MMATRYKDLNLLTLWIENQKSLNITLGHSISTRRLLTTFIIILI